MISLLGVGFLHLARLGDPLDGFDEEDDRQNGCEDDGEKEQDRPRFSNVIELSGFFPRSSSLRFQKNRQLRFSFKNIRFPLILQVFNQGLNTAFCRSMGVVRSIAFNYIIFSVASTYAMSAFSMYSSIKGFLLAIPSAIAAQSKRREGFF